MNVRFCASCRALILSGYRYCPYCGTQAPRGPGIEEALDPPFMRIQAEGKGGRAAADGRAADRFAAAWEELARLEAEMECLIEGEGIGRCTEI